jgi:CheY-like chemotaxis protein
VVRESLQALENRTIITDLMTPVTRRSSKYHKASPKNNSGSPGSTNNETVTPTTAEEQNNSRTPHTDDNEDKNGSFHPGRVLEPIPSASESKETTQEEDGMAIASLPVLDVSASKSHDNFSSKLQTPSSSSSERPSQQAVMHASYDDNDMKPNHTHEEGSEKVNNNFGKKIDLILMDNFMKEMDGPQAAKIIRNLGYDGPILGVTGMIDDGCDEFLDSGVDLILRKPINMSSIWNALKSLQYI